MVGGVLRALFCFAVVVAAQRHRHVAHLARDFAFCVSEINVRDAFRTVKFAPEETAGEAAARVFAAAGADALDERIRPIAAFLEHRASLVLMERSEFRFALRSSQRVGAPGFVTSQACDERAVDGDPGAILDRHGAWVMLDLNHFNADRASDWAFYFGDRPAAAAALGCAATRPLDDAALGAVARHAAQALLPGAALQFAVDAPRARRRRSGRGLSPDRDHGVDALDDGPAPRSVFDAPRRAPGRAALPHLDAVLILNLARRPDRWRAMRMLAAAGFGGDVRRVDAVDGAALDVSDAAVASIFNLTRWRYGAGARNAHQDHGYRPRVIGCALSHLAAWKAVAPAADDHAMHLVLEDDAVFVDDFAAKWASLAPHLAADYSWNLLHLGVLDDRDLYDDARSRSTAASSGSPRGAVLRRGRLRSRVRAAHGALVSTRPGIQQAVDWWIAEKFDELVAYKASPQLAASPAGDGRDSDNNEFYDQDRLLLDEGAGAADFDGFALSAPRPGDRVPAGAALEANQFRLPGSALAAPAWYALNATIADDAGAVLASAAVAFEARDPSLPEAFTMPPPLSRAASAALVPVEISVDGAAAAVDCRGRPDLFACVQAFCELHRIEPLVDCVAPLVATLHAQVAV
ncbi:procollagen galactosyltransferase [Aureococcus anophagefferens]|nr:procollagen galactosyltransferase [Aureococcus anophagefferens]